ncbi:MAG: hypothetical protein LBV74_08740 [Tannerella sp.]|jgi:hypothetical protein|nr:hypothetical protein [Tannerella sp.]
MITDTTGKLSNTSKGTGGRDFFWILKNIKEIIEKQGLDEAAITALQNQLQTLTENGQIDTVEITNALIHNLMVDGIFTPDTQTIRGITGPGNWVVGWYGKNTPPGISNTLGTAGEPSIVMLSCVQPNQEAQLCAFWTDKSIAALYGQNEINLPYVSMSVDVDPATSNPCLILEVNQALFDHFPNTEIILSSWAINFTPNNNSYKFDTTPKYFTSLAGEGGFSISSLTLNGDFNFENIGVENATISNLNAASATVAGSPVVTETILQSAMDSKVSKAGDTMTGALILNGAPTEDLHATTMKWVTDVIAAIQAKGFDFKGFISSTLPTVDVREGNQWFNKALNPAEMPPVVFPWSVETYTSGAWDGASTDYTPEAMHLWYDVDNSEAWYYIGNTWERLDFSDSAFDAAFFVTIAGAISIKSGSITDNEIAVNAAIAQSKIYGLSGSLAAKAPINSPTFTGTVKVPNKASALINDGTLIATEAQVLRALPEFMKFGGPSQPYTSIAAFAVGEGNGWDQLSNSNYPNYTDLPEGLSGTCSMQIMGFPTLKTIFLWTMNQPPDFPLWMGHVANATTPTRWKRISPIDYSNVEQNTGVRWTDGKNIYQRTSITSLPVIAAATWTIVGTIASILPGAATVIKVEQFWAAPIAARINAGNVELWSAVARPAGGLTITYWYTKT